MNRRRLVAELHPRSIKYFAFDEHLMLLEALWPAGTPLNAGEEPSSKVKVPPPKVGEVFSDPASACTAGPFQVLPDRAEIREYSFIITTIAFSCPVCRQSASGGESAQLRGQPSGCLTTSRSGSRERQSGADRLMLV